MQLRQRATDAPRVYRGPGRIIRDPAGALRLTIYGPGPIAPEEFAQQPSHLGSMVPPQAYYDLEARDLYGRTWHSTYVHPSLVAVDFETWAVVTAELQSIEAAAALEQNQDRQDEHLTLHFHTAVDLPCNRRTVTHTAVEGEEGAAVAVRWNVARFEALDRQFDIRPGERGFVVDARGNSPAPPGFEHHTVDALRFVLGAVPDVAVAQLRTGALERVTVHSIGKPDGMSGLDRPVPGHIVDAEDHTWRLFDRYLRHVCTAGDGRHPLSITWMGVVRAASGSVETQALVWSVAVEQVVLMRPAAEEDEELRRELVSWAEQASEALRERACPKHVYKRLAGLLFNAKNLTQPSPRNTLRALAQNSTLRRIQVGTWEHVRNASTHAGFQAAKDPAGRWREVLVVLTLIYRLVYDTIGYDGPLADYYTELE